MEEYRCRTSIVIINVPLEKIVILVEGEGIQLPTLRDI